LNSEDRVVLSTTKKLALTLIALIAVAAFGVAQTPPAAPAADAKPQKVAKDQAEADLINSIASDKDAAHKLQNLDKWSKDYPDTAFATERLQEYLGTYGQLKDFKNQSRIAATILKTDPNNEEALRAIIGGISQIKSPDASDFDTAEKAADYLVAHADEIYSDAKKPAGTAAPAWQQFKLTMIAAAKHAVPNMDIQRKDNAKAEADLTKLLQADPTDAVSSYMLAGVLFGQREKNPEKQAPAIFEYARAGVYDGPNALPAANRQQILAAATKTYKLYHGSDEGSDKLLAVAKTNALPPADFTIKSTADLEKERLEAEAKADADDPVFATWKTIKAGLTADGDAAYFDNNVKEAEFPPGGKKFKGKIVSMKPLSSPTKLVMAYKDPVGDITLVLETPLRGKMDIGSELEFEGQASAYTKAPFMLTLKIGADENKDKIIGWKPVAAPSMPKKAAPGVKKQP
jgi:hypothetical protein